MSDTMSQTPPTVEPPQQPQPPMQPRPHTPSSNPVQTANFWLGFLASVAIMSVIGLIVTTTLLYKAGASPATVTANTNTAPTQPTVGGDQYYPTQPTAPTGPVQLKDITDADHIRGNKDAAVTVVTFTDLECPFCQTFDLGALKQAVSEYGDRVRFVYKWFPLETIHPNARAASNAAECANEQGKFFEFVDQTFSQQSAMSNDLFPKIAGDLGLDVNAFNDCVASGKYNDLIDQHLQEGFAAGVQGTPGSFVNGMPVEGAVPYAQLKAEIEAALAQ